VKWLLEEVESVSVGKEFVAEEAGVVSLDVIWEMEEAEVVSGDTEKVLGKVE
ncbi:hypothetical protein NDU88_004540, partial [Pleurodeles waltl]